MFTFTKMCSIILFVIGLFYVISNRPVCGLSFGLMCILMGLSSYSAKR